MRQGIRNLTRIRTHTHASTQTCFSWQVHVQVFSHNRAQSPKGLGFISKVLHQVLLGNSRLSQTGAGKSVHIAYDGNTEQLTESKTHARGTTELTCWVSTYCSRQDRMAVAGSSAPCCHVGGKIETKVPQLPCMPGHNPPSDCMCAPICQLKAEPTASQPLGFLCPPFHPPNSKWA